MSSNLTSMAVTLSGFQQLFNHRYLFLPLFLFLWLFLIFSDSLVVFTVFSRPVLHRPMFVFIAAVLSNSLVASCVVYPKLLFDLASRYSSVQVSRASCLIQAFFVHTFGSSSFLLLATMAFDRFLSITQPLRYAALMSPRVVRTLIFICWLVPLFLVSVGAILASRLQLCTSSVVRLYCDMYSFVSMSCSDWVVQIINVYGLLMATLLVFLPAAFVVFSYGHILFVCLWKSQSFSSKALRTCGPHITVFLNYSLSAAFELLQRRIENMDHVNGNKLAVNLSVAASILVVVIPTVFNPLVYGLKVTEIYSQISKLLRRKRRP